MAKATPTSGKRNLKAAPPAPERGIEAKLHAACVKAGAGAALQVTLERLPMLKPFLPLAITEVGRGDAPERIQRLLVKEIYARYHVRPAAWELEGILAVAQTQSVMTPLASQAGLQSVLRGWIPDRLSSPLIRYTPLEPLVTATAKAVAATWAAGRYADSVCRLRRAGADWLPAPLAQALNLAPSKLRDWSAEALNLALPPLRLATSWGLRLSELAMAAPPESSTSSPRRTARKPATAPPQVAKRSAKATATAPPAAPRRRRTPL
jgi:hypothetical protein